MDDENLKSKLMEVLSRAPRAIQRERKSGEWTQEQIVQDFIAGLDSWHPERR